ncbi:MAG: hypothetical protein ACXWN4_07040 [Candidatus Limnocylindrales bacterium]
MIIDPEPVNPHVEPCLSCGEETAVGSCLFSDRNRVDLEAGAKGYLCAECAKRARLAAMGASDGQMLSSTYALPYLMMGAVHVHHVDDELVDPRV